MMHGGKLTINDIILFYSMVSDVVGLKDSTSVVIIRSLSGFFFLFFLNRSLSG